MQFHYFVFFANMEPEINFCISNTRYHFLNIAFFTRCDILKWGDLFESNNK